MIPSVTDHGGQSGIGNHIAVEGDGSSIILRHDHGGDTVGRHHRKESAELFAQFFSIIVYDETGALAGNVAARRHRSNGAVLPVGVELVPIAL